MNYLIHYTNWFNSEIIEGTHKVNFRTPFYTTPNVNIKWLKRNKDRRKEIINIYLFLNKIKLFLRKIIYTQRSKKLFWYW